MPLEPSLDPRVRALLVCPLCRGELEDTARGLRCAPCRRLYPVIEGVPRMAPEEALRS
ncbi:MAG: Trm112 family protein [Alphaproteobacteria bacterium]|nr:Trm112 family protein [Alphaproteobacteria bacterium]